MHTDVPFTLVASRKQLQHMNVDCTEETCFLLFQDDWLIVVG